MELYNYKTYEQYAENQITRYKAKEDRLWLKPQTAARIAAEALSDLPSTLFAGLCHGARNGREVEMIATQPGMENCTIIGTDIAPGCSRYPDMVCHDFHEPKAQWLGAMTFVYSNALDHAVRPDKALATWMDQLVPGGRLIIEWTKSHGGHVNNADCFAAGLHEYWKMLDTFGPTRCERVEGLDVWLFVTRKES